MAADQLFYSIGEDLEQERVDSDAALGQVGDDALCAVVERGSHDHDLVALVQRVFVEFLPEAPPEVVGQAAVGSEAAVDGGNVVRVQAGRPAGVIQGLRDDLARRAVPLELNQDDGSVGSDGQEIDASAEAGVLLAADRHPFPGKQALTLV